MKRCVLPSESVNETCGRTIALYSPFIRHWDIISRESANSCNILGLRRSGNMQAGDFTPYMMDHSLISEYARTLAELSGDDFEDEVSARLESVIVDFQSVPASPQGDAGLDAFSHGGERAYCCYGPLHNAFKTNKGRENDIIKKFRGDLQSLYEVGYVKKKLTVVETAEMKTILPSGKTIKHIELICNWFESHRVLNPLNDSRKEYADVSKCRYVEKTSTIKIVGPKELANRYAVDEATIGRARQRIFAQKVEKIAESMALGSTEKFDKKMADLKVLVPGQDDAIAGLRERLQADWRMALAFERELGDTLPAMHRALERNRARILGKVTKLIVGSDKPWTELIRATEMAAEILKADFDPQSYGMVIEDVSSGEIARLIGECPVGWGAAAESQVSNAKG